MKLYYGGAELPIWRKLLAAEGITDVSMSFAGLSKRVVSFDKPWLIAEKFPDDQNIFLDSGAFSYNDAEEDKKLTRDELLELSGTYQMFVTSNIDRVTMVSEFDAVDLGEDYISGQRQEFYDGLGDKFLPVWHEGDGLEELERLCASYSRVAVTGAGIKDHRTINALNNFAGRYGVRLHGAGTKMDQMKSISWDSVGSTSWMSPSHYGDTAVWVGNELKRYPKKYKDQARSRHRTLFEQNGFDAELIIADDRTEVLRLSLWSWQKFMEHINGKRVTPQDETPDSENAETPPGAVDHQLSVSRNGDIVVSRETELIPNMGIRQDVQSGDMLYTTRSDSMRMCNTCFLKDKCAGYMPDANCLYGIPVSVRTPTQMKALQDGLVEMQFQRVKFMEMAEQASGGYVDSNLSGEIDRLQRLIKAKMEGESEKFSLKMDISRPAQGQPSLMAQLMGAKLTDQISRAEYPDTVDADAIIEAEINEE